MTTWVVADAVLFAVLGSCSFPATVAVLVMLPAGVFVFTWTWIVKLVVAPEARLPMAQVRVDTPLQGIEVDSSVTEDGSVSVTTTLVAFAGPPLVTAIV